MLSVKEDLSYDYESGLFLWERPTSNRVKKGQVAGTLGKRGYITIRYKGKIYPAHRLAYFFMLNFFPKDFVDHINGNKEDNSWRNLRVCSMSENLRNMKTEKLGASSYKGVYFCKKAKKWCAQIQKDKVKEYLGAFKKEEDAAKAYNERAKSLFGPFARLNNIKKET